MLRYRSVSVLNILGLSMGIAICVSIFIYVRFETSYDDYHPGADRLYRVEKISNIYNEVEKIASIPVYLSDEIKGYDKSTSNFTKTKRVSKANNKLFVVESTPTKYQLSSYLAM